MRKRLDFRDDLPWSKMRGIDLPGFSRSGCSTAISLAGANLEAAVKNDPCFLPASSVLGLALSILTCDFW